MTPNTRTLKGQSYCSQRGQILFGQKGQSRVAFPGDNDSTMDDAAATYAMDKVLNDILSDCKDGQEIEDKLHNATDDDLHEWIITFEIEYILEYSAELFQSHIFDKGSNPEEIKKDMRGWLHNELDEKLSKELTQIDFNSREGKEYLDSLTSEILDIWKQE